MTTAELRQQALRLYHKLLRAQVVTFKGDDALIRGTLYDMMHGLRCIAALVRTREEFSKPIQDRETLTKVQYCKLVRIRLLSFVPIEVG